MKSINANFNRVQLLSPNYSSYLCFANAVKDKRFSLASLQKNFNNLVDKNDYEKQDKSKLISNLYKLSNTPEEEGFRAKNGF
jgi:hypothetical protein